MLPDVMESDAGTLSSLTLIFYAITLRKVGQVTGKGEVILLPPTLTVIKRLLSLNDKG